jgi:hypothetical protein
MPIGAGAMPLEFFAADSEHGRDFAAPVAEVPRVAPAAMDLSPPETLPNVRVVTATPVRGGRARAAPGVVRKLPPRTAGLRIERQRRARRLLIAHAWRAIG